MQQAAELAETDFERIFISCIRRGHATIRLEFLLDKLSRSYGLMVLSVHLICFRTDGAGVLTGWDRLGIPAGDHVVIRRSIGIEGAKS
jgi:hypothetical protein